MTHPLRVHVNTCINVAPNPCAKRKVHSLTKPKGKIYKTKSLGNYITISLCSTFPTSSQRLPLEEWNKTAIMWILEFVFVTSFPNRTDPWLIRFPPNLTTVRFPFRNRYDVGWIIFAGETGWPESITSTFLHQNRLIRQFSKSFKKRHRHFVLAKKKDHSSVFCLLKFFFKYSKFWFWSKSKLHLFNINTRK